MKVYIKNVSPALIIHELEVIFEVNYYDFRNFKALFIILLMVCLVAEKQIYWTMVGYIML